MKKLVLLFAVLLLALPFIGIQAQEQEVVDAVAEFAALLPDQGYGVLQVADLTLELVENPELVLLDVREATEFVTDGYIEGAFNVPIRTLGQNLNLLPNLDAKIVVICKSAGRAMLAATSLRILGYTDVRVMAGGMNAWIAAGNPISFEVVEAPAAGEVPAFDAVVLGAVDTFLSTLPEGFGIVSAQNLAAELVENPPLLIDVRSAEEFANGYIEGAQHIWINEFFASQDQWPADKEANIVVYCQSGYRGGIATVMLELMGYSNVRNLGGGVNAWNTAELPLAGVPAPDEEAFDLTAFLTAYVAALPNNFNAVRPADLAAEIDGGAELVLVDVRTADEYAEGFIPGAFNLPLQELTSHLDLLPDLDAPIVVYCGSGHRSALAMTMLTMLGYTNVRSMMSGFGAWTGASLPVSQEAVVVEPGTAPEFDANVYPLVEGLVALFQDGYLTVRAADLSLELADNPPFLLDVRTDSEWAEGHIEGAVFVTLRDLMTSLDQLPADPAAPIVVYDNPTHRSSMALIFLKLLGYENVRALGGGVGAWTNGGFELVTE